MKKLLLCFLSLLCLLAFMASADTPFLKFEFSHNAGDSVKAGDTVECTVKYTDINSVGLSSVELVISHSNGLKYNNDAAVAGLASEWSLWEPNVSENSIKFGIVDDSAVTPGVNDMTLTFSFTVVSEGFGSEFIRVSESYIYDFDINEVKDVASTTVSPSFVSNLPEVNVENKGASLRINNTPAIRFGASITAIPATAEYGMIYAKSEELEGELTHSSRSAKELELQKLGDNLFATEAVEISSNTEKYTFRPYVKLAMDDGNDYYVYFTALERSAEDVALAELNTEKDEEKAKLLKSFCTNT